MNKQVKSIVAEIKKIAKERGCEPQEITKAIFLAESEVTNGQLRTLGGLEGIKKAYLPEKEKNLAAINDIKKDKSYVESLEKSLGAKLSFEEELKTALKGLKMPVVKAKKKLKVSTNKDFTEVVGMLNDTHIGVVVDSEEVNGGNSFNFKEACRRFAFYCKQLGNYKKYKRNQVRKLHLILNGDLIAGIIHGLDTKTIHLMVHQVNAAIHIFTHSIEYLSKEYNTIEIHGIAGNHERAVHKNHGKRAVAEVYDSYANIIFYALSTAFKNNKNISFNFPKTPYGFIDLPAGRAAYFHGDHIFSSALGNPGSTINTKSMGNAIREFNAGEIAKGNAPLKLLLFGHVHSFGHFITSDGVEVYISPSLSGLDQFAHSLTINHNFIAQPLFESAKDFILGDSRLVRLNDADKDKELDLIIPTYNMELKWTK